MRYGAETLTGGGVRYALWAPSCADVRIERSGADGSVLGVDAMQRDADGWHEFVCPASGAGTRYRFRVAPELAVPDPASRSNPDGVHAASEVVDPAAYLWKDASWRGRPWHGAVVYELHVGTFTPQGTFEAAAAKLPYLRDLGVTAVELMPVAAYAGERGWGYDGVLPYAPHARYGRPEGLKRFVDAAHRLRLMVLLDVVYNHFGPDGNYLHAYCPELWDASRRTPWGDALRLEGPGSAPVRRYFVDNALYWVEEYRFDGLRLDAVHAMSGSPGDHLVDDIGRALREGPGREREVHLVLENDANTAAWLVRDANGRPRAAVAQWNDDWHHAAHVLATGESDGYYADYASSPVASMARALAEGWVYQGEPSAFRGGLHRGSPSAGLPPQAFVAFLQNHDQVGNRAFGERIDAQAPAERVDALLACLLLSPQVPLLFMGEEYGASTPFLYFCDHAGELGSAVAHGRRQEFASRADFAGETASHIPDPNARSTFDASMLRWDELLGDAGRRRHALVSGLLALRHAELDPLLAAQQAGGRYRLLGDAAVDVEWTLGGAIWRLCANFGAEAAAVEARAGERTVHRSGGGAQAAAPLGRDEVLVTVRRT
jgi:maltooligosyltrehalose trehalohydrolase